MSEIDWRAQILDQLTFAWEVMFLPRMDGLTDEEYLWEPVSDVWTVHLGDPPAVDYGLELDPAPFTTIAWRLWHMTDVFVDRTRLHFGDGVRELVSDVGATADEALTMLRQAYLGWLDAIRAMPGERLTAPCGPEEGPFAAYPFAALVLHINREFIHHAAECALLRDLYRQRESA